MLFVDLGKDGEELGETTVGDELFGTVQSVVFAVPGQHGRGLGAKGVAARTRFGQAVGGTPFTADDLAQVLLLLLRRTVVDERQSADAGVGGEGHRE